MRLWLIHFLMWLLGGFSLKYRKMEGEKITNFLTNLHKENSGYRDYYTWRKKHIMESLSLGLEGKEYWLVCGRLMELHYLNGLSVKVMEREEKATKRAAEIKQLPYAAPERQ